MRTRLTAAALCLLMASTALAGEANTSAIPDSAKWVVHVDVAAVTASGIANGVINIMTGKNSPLPAADVQKVVDGWKFAGNIHSLTLYGPGPDEADAIAIVTAKYDENTIKNMLKIDAQNATVAHGGHVIYTFAGKDKAGRPRDQYGCFYNNTTMLGGANIAKVKAALDVLDGKAGAKALAKDNPLTAMIAPSKGSFLVVAAADVNRMVAQAAKDNPDPATAMLAKAQDLRFEVGQLEANMYVNANATMLAEEDAKTVQTMLNGLIAMAMFRGGNDPAAMKLLQAIQVGCKGKNVSVDISFPVETILDTFAKVLAARLAAVKAAAPDNIVK